MAPDLADLLVEVVRAVAGAEHDHLVGMVPSRQLVDVRHRLAQRAAGVVLPDEEDHRGARTESAKWIGLRSAISSGTSSGVPPISARS